jgi:hypothetical protein
VDDFGEGSGRARQPIRDILVPPLTRHAWIPLLAIAALCEPVRAESCPAGVELSGDPEAIAAVAELLGARGVVLAATRCGAVRVRIERIDRELAIDVEQTDGTLVHRVAGEAQTAATVIESFTRADVGDPLLARRAVPAEPPPRRSEHEEATSQPSQMLRAARGVHLLSAFETSYASDRTSWFGAHIGACVMLGPVCAAARLRFSGVTDGPGVWKGDIERRSVELLVGIDIPFAVGRWTLSPGFALGIGQLHTRGETHDMRADTGRACADVHVALSIPVSTRLAIDVFSAADLMQETRAEADMSMQVPVVMLPDEPRFLVRVGVGLRYGGL